MLEPELVSRTHNYSLLSFLISQVDCFLCQGLHLWPNWVSPKHRLSFQAKTLRVCSPQPTDSVSSCPNPRIQKEMMCLTRLCFYIEASGSEEASPGLRWVDSSLAIGEMAAEETCTDTVTLEAEDTGREQAINSLECIAGGACIFPESNGVCLERF